MSRLELYHNFLSSNKIPHVSIPLLFKKICETYGSYTAIRDKEAVVTYAQLYNRSKNLADNLRDLGFLPGDCIAIMLRNGISYVEYFFAIQLIGGIVVQVNPMYQKEELETILFDSQAKGIVCSRSSIDKINPSIIKIFIEDKFVIKNCEFDYSKNHINPLEEVALLQYTGGTTGLPKGVMLTHFNVIINLKQHFLHGEKIYSEANHSLLGIPPLFHAMGLTNMILIFSIGGTYIPVERFNMDDVINLIREYRPTLFQGSPTMYLGLLNYEGLDNNDLDSFRLCASGSGPAPVDMIERFHKNSNAIFIEGYGLSEATTLVFRNPIKGVKKAGSIGLPVPLTSVRIVDQKTGSEIEKIHEIGELLIKGPQVMKGYWNNVQETDNVLKHEWLYTGDLVYRDEDGYYYIAGRKKDMVITGGYNVYPSEVENVLLSNPKVKDACVIGIPDSYKGEVLHAFIVIKQPMTEAETINWCKSKLTKYKVPQKIVFRDSLPRNSVGKLLKNKLKESL